MGPVPFGVPAFDHGVKLLDLLRVQNGSSFGAGLFTNSLELWGNLVTQVINNGATTTTSTLVVGAAAAFPFRAASFDVVVSTLSLHHWSDPAAGLAEIARVLRVGGRALIWDFRPGASPHPFAPPHMEPPKATDHLKGSGLELVSVAPWRWPWRFTFIQRTELRKMEKQKRPLARKRSKSF